MKARKAPAAAIALVVCLGAAACGGDDEPPPPQELPAFDPDDPHAREAHLYAGESLEKVFPALEKKFEPQKGGELIGAFGPSNVVAQEIREGAVPGVFLSESLDWVDKLEEWGLAEKSTRVVLLANSLVVVVPKTGALRPEKIEDLASKDYARVVLADPDRVPAGRYAKAALTAAGVFAELGERLVVKPDVREALSAVEREEAEAAVVYATDAQASTLVETVIRIDPALHPKIVYPMILVKGANRRSRLLWDWLKGEVAMAEFEKAGFKRALPPK